MADQISGATNQLGIFGRTTTQIWNDIKSRNFSSLFHIIPQKEITAVKQYGEALFDNTQKFRTLNELLKTGQITQRQYNENYQKLTGNIEGLSTSAQLACTRMKTLHSSYVAGKIDANEYNSEVNKIIASQQSATITTQIWGMALRTALNVGVSLLINAIINGITKLVNAEKESIQATQDAAKESNNYINSLTDLKSKYEEIINSTKTASEKAQDLKKWKSELVQLYKDEKDAIEDVNLERETGISLLETEIRRTRDLWLGENKGNIEKAVRAIENSQYSDLQFVLNNDEIFSEGIRKEILELFDNYSQDTDEFKEFLTGLFNGYSQQTAEFKFDTDNIYDTKKRLEDVIALFGSFTDELSPNERELLAQLNNYKDKIDEVIQAHGTTYQTYKEYLAQNSADDLFDEYIKQQGKNIASVTEETFNAWKEGLIALAGESEPIRKALQEIIDNTFPQYVEKEEEITNGSNGVSGAITSLSERIEELKKSYDDAFSNQSTIQSAFDKIQKGTSLTSNEMLKLIEVCDDVFPEIGSLFKKTADGYTISADDLIRANDAIIKSAKDVIQADKETIESRQKAIEAQLNNPLANDSRFDIFKALRKEYVENENQLKALDLILSAFGLTVEDTAEKINDYNDVLKYTQTLNKMLGSLDTANSLLSNWADTDQWKKEFSDVVDAIVEAFPNDNKIKRAAQKWFGDQTKDSAQALIDEYARAYETDLDNFNEYNQNKLSNDETTWDDFIKDNTAFVNEFKTAYETDLTNFATYTSARQALMDQILEMDDDFDPLTVSAEREALWDKLNDFDAKFKDYIGGTFKPFNSGSGSGSSSDPTKDAYTEKQKELKHLLEMEKITQAQYYEMLFGSNEYKALLANRTKYRDELNSIDEEYYKYQQNLYKENADKQFDDLEDQRKRGIITAEQYAQGLYDLGQELYGEGSVYGGTEFAVKALEELDKKVKETSDDIYNEFKEGLSADGDKLLDNVLDDADKLSERNIELFSDNPKTFKKNAEDIFETVSKSAQDALEQGLITPERYKEIIDLYGKGLDTSVIQNAYDDAFDKIADSGKDKLDKMLITPDEYFKLLDEWGKKLGIANDVIQNYRDAVSVDDVMSSWDLENNYDDTNSKNNFELRQNRIDEFRKQIVKAYGVDGVNNVKAYTDAMKEADEQQKQLNEDTYAKTKDDLSADGDKALDNILSDAETLWNDTLSLFSDNDIIKENAQDIYSSVSEALKDALEKGIITPDEYETQIRDWGNKLNLTEADITDALVNTYEYRANALQKANDSSLASERKYIADMKSLNFSTYGDENSDFYDPNTYASNLRDITDRQLDVLEKALNNGEISVQEYANSVVEIFKDADVLGADYVSEKLDDIDKVRAEREKTYWEQQKELMEDYYDKQIKEIEDTQKAKEKENKLEELHLKLIKARQTLEEAKNNRNQLVFHDGTFEYMADQDAIMSAEEEVANTLKEIEDEKLQAQIDLLEEQKDAALGFYDQILDEIDFYINKTLPLSESDQEEFAKIRNSDYAQYARDKRDGNLTANSDNEKIAEDALNQTDATEETKQSVSDIAKNVLDIAKIVANGFNFENLVRALGGNPTPEGIKNFQDSYNATLVGKQIVPSTLPSSVTNNSSTTNNATKVINVGGITVKLELAVQSLDDFVNNKIDTAMTKLGNAIEQEMPMILAKI